jgi:hypothetical protein
MSVMSIDRRALIASAAALFASGASAQAKPEGMTIYKTASCGCCNGWIKHMRVAGYAPKVVVVEDISVLSAKKGVPFQYSSCHMGEAGGYVLLGHIPPADVARLLKEKPKAIGLSVPGMPWGSPGMEGPKGEKEAYETLLLLPGGKTRVFARHA